MEGIKKLLDEIIIDDSSLYELTEPLISKCEEITENEKEFQKCLKEAFFAGLYVTENLELPPGLKPTTAHNINSKFEFVKAKL